MDEKEKLSHACIHASPGDIILIRYDSERISVAETHAMWAYLKDKFPENLVIFLPQALEVNTIARNQVSELIEYLKKECGLTDE